MQRLVDEHGVRAPQPDPSPGGARHEPPAIEGAARNLVRGTGMLTEKEREVLTLLSRNLSNKEIAQAMDIGEQTIKWHVKNLFQKLNAASRKHAVARARMLGLVEP